MKRSASDTPPAFAKRVKDCRFGCDISALLDNEELATYLTQLNFYRGPPHRCQLLLFCLQAATPQRRLKLAQFVLTHVPITAQHLLEFDVLCPVVQKDDPGLLQWLASTLQLQREHAVAHHCSALIAALNLSSPVILQLLQQPPFLLTKEDILSVANNVAVFPFQDSFLQVLSTHYQCQQQDILHLLHASGVLFQTAATAHFAVEQYLLTCGDTLVHLFETLLNWSPGGQHALRLVELFSFSFDTATMLELVQVAVRAGKWTVVGDLQLRHPALFPVVRSVQVQDKELVIVLQQLE